VAAADRWRSWVVLVPLFGAASCATATSTERPTPSSPRQAHLQCAAGAPMRVHFYDVGQALAVLVELPNGALLLVDAGESASRAGCGKDCAAWHAHLMDKLRADVGDKAIDLLWVTHPHSDHVGGALDILEHFKVQTYADNGSLRANATVTNTLEQAKQRGARVVLTQAGSAAAALGIEGSAALSVRELIPSPWPVDCDKKPNDCSAALRIDYCGSSVLFTGDAESVEEGTLAVDHVDLLQVGHHGSNTSSSAAFLERVKPQWAVISAGHRDSGTNRTYCHPRASTVSAVSSMLGDLDGSPVDAFDGASCRGSTDGEWKGTRASSHLFVTARDGDVVLVTTGDGRFAREQ
jgi:competence protein ComEC